MTVLFFLQHALAASFVASLGLKHELIKTETILKNEKLIEWRYSDSKSPHLLQYFDQKGRLIREKSDGDKNGVFERFSTFNPVNQVTEKHFDTDQDGVVDRLQRWEASKEFIVIKEYSLNGKTKTLEFISQNKIRRDEALKTELSCDSSGDENPILRSVNAFKPLLSELLITSKGDGWSQTNFGPRIHDNCLKKFGPEFPALVQRGLKKGISCLSNLEGPAPRENITKIASILENETNPLKIYCGTTPYLSEFQWQPNAIAMAKLPGEEGFPGISFNPAFNRPPVEDEMTVMHELLHNCGHIHAEGEIEYMYACPECCALKPTDKTAGSCRICNGEFSSTGSIEYQLALGNLVTMPANQKYFLLSGIFSGKVERRPDAPLVLLRSLQSSPGDEDLRAQLYLYYSQQGLINGTQTYLTPPSPPATQVSPEVADLGRALSMASAGQNREAIFSLKNSALVTSKLAKDNRLREYYRSIISEAWNRTFENSKSNPKDKVLKKDESEIWKIYQYFSN